MTNISVDEVKSRLDAGEKLIIIDCREPYEYNEFHIGGTLIPLGRFQTFQLEELEDLKDEEIIVHCRSGSRSAQACLILDTMGFKNTKNLKGGMMEWQEKFGSSL